MNLLRNLIDSLRNLFRRPVPTPVPTPTPEPTPTPIPTPTPTPVPTPVDDVTKQLLDSHNAQRAKYGISPLTLDSRLNASAQGHTDYMAKVNQLAHEGIGDGTPWSRMEAAGYQYSNAGENIAWNQRSVEEVTNAWMSDAGHRANVLGNFKNVGFGKTQRWDGSIYWGADFGSPA